jgi:ferrous iron transport protein A
MSEWQHQVSPKTLSDLPVGARAVVRGLRGGKGFIGRVAVLGFTVGAEVAVVQNYGRGPIIVAVRDTRVALGRGEAAKIQVEVMRET